MHRPSFRVSMRTIISTKRPDALTKYLPAKYRGGDPVGRGAGANADRDQRQDTEFMPNPTFEKVAAPGAQPISTPARIRRA